MGLGTIKVDQEPLLVRVGENAAVLGLVTDQVDRRGRLSRRQWLRFGTLAGLSLAGGGPLLTNAAQANEATGSQLPGFGRAKSVLLVFCSGGQSQLDTWDPKPNAPENVRGEFNSISTAVPGARFCEHMPRIARIADRLTVLRSVSHEDLDHGSACYLTLTGRYHDRRSSNPPPRPNDYPTYGALLKRVRPTDRFPHDCIHVNGPAQVPRVIAPGQGAGLLGRAYDPLVVGDVTGQAVALEGLDPQEQLPLARIDERRALKSQLDQYAGQLGKQRKLLDMNTLYRQAYQLLADPRARAAFHLDAEPASLRDRYGRHRSGQACLLGRRLIEAGVPLVTVVWNHSNRGQDIDDQDTGLYGWDTHNDVFGALRNHLLPRFDASFSTLIEDMDDRGLLDSTLVICLGEFGRAPQVAFEAKFAGRSPGRKHWASVYSVALAGAGVARGGVFGESDRLGAEPKRDRVGPWDLAATMFHALGISPRGHYLDPLDRPLPITVGQPITGLFA